MNKLVSSNFSLCFEFPECACLERAEAFIKLGQLLYEIDQDTRSIFVELRSSTESDLAIKISKELAPKRIRLFCATTAETDNFVIQFPKYILDVIGSLESEVQVSVILI